MTSSLSHQVIDRVAPLLADLARQGVARHELMVEVLEACDLRFQLTGLTDDPLVVMFLNACVNLQGSLFHFRDICFHCDTVF